MEVLHFSSTSFSPKTELTTGSTKDVVASADFNGDGKPDLAVYSSGSAAIKICSGHNIFVEPVVNSVLGEKDVEENVVLPPE